MALRPRRRRRTGRWLAGAMLVLLGTGFAVRFVDLAEGHVPARSLVSDTLQLPDRTLTTALPPAATPPPAPAPARAMPVALADDAPFEPRVALLTRPGDAAATTPDPAGSAPTTAAEAAPVDATPVEPAGADTTRWVERRIDKGDNLAAIFKDLGLSANLLHRITHSSDLAATLADIRPGQTLRVQLDDQDEFVSLRLERDRLTTLRIETQDEDGFAAAEERKDVERRVATATGTIQSSLFVDGQKAGLTDTQIMELAAIFGWDIDFALELRAGDQFSLVYEDLYLEGEPLRPGDILAAEFVNRGTTYRALRYESPDGSVGYYDAEGRNKKLAFIRTPVKFSRISSGFTTNRWHPVLKRWRSHKGVDYAAPTGTPVRATGAGRVAFKGTQGGYGRVVMIEHAGKYTTVYGHLSRFAKKVGTGTRVKQGQVIGYVGQSGLATGPHLHYEFRVAGVHRNPLTVKLPKNLPLEDHLIKDFRTKTRPLLARLENASQRTVVASVDGPRTTATD